MVGERKPHVIIHLTPFYKHASLALPALAQRRTSVSMDGGAEVRILGYSSFAFFQAPVMNEPAEGLGCCCSGHSRCPSVVIAGGLPVSFLLLVASRETIFTHRYSQPISGRVGELAERVQRRV